MENEKEREREGERYSNVLCTSILSMPSLTFFLSLSLSSSSIVGRLLLRFGASRKRYAGNEDKAYPFQTLI